MWRLLKRKVSQGEKARKLKEGLKGLIKDKEIIRTEEIKEWVGRFN